MIAPDAFARPLRMTFEELGTTFMKFGQLVSSSPGVFGEEAARLGALVIHYSTDYVFDGCVSGAYLESDTPNPQSVYGPSINSPCCSHNAGAPHDP